ncbi:hypothetical protein H6G76_25480 [Nostoc sp. FACHB-152]|uniref:hypothetical protein n=1 Tax=unclassified Nostoc TaxID=2593658 RepID=UPI0016859886|nr:MULTISPECIES: hypothetical protein [unclassified Nostoc]MBD2450445.1 hypothetical protein [Nostoc sp. FACHB-152]MBD2471666.1 hypothetical protein [Nostoc sp. FACHB-145]
MRILLVWNIASYFRHANKTIPVLFLNQLGDRIKYLNQLLVSKFYRQILKHIFH